MELHKDDYCGEYIALVHYPGEIEIATVAGFELTDQPGRMISKSIDSATKLLQYSSGELLTELVLNREKLRESNSELLDESNAIASNIVVPAPAGKNYLPFQKAGIDFCYKHGNALIGDEMGLGKTIQAIGLINLDSSIQSVLVICPASLRLNWKLELQNWLVAPKSIGLPYPKKPFPDTDIIVIHYDLLHKFKDDLSVLG